MVHALHLSAPQSQLLFLRQALAQEALLLPLRLLIINSVFKQVLQLVLALRRLQRFIRELLARQALAQEARLLL